MLFIKGKTDALRCNGVLLAGPGSDGIMVTWKDNFDSFYSEVAELGRYDVKHRTPPTTVRSLIIPRLMNRKCCHQYKELS